MAQEDVFKKLVSHCKEYGFVFPSSEIYDGLGAVYDYGQYGVDRYFNIKRVPNLMWYTGIRVGFAYGENDEITEKCEK